MYSPKIAEDLIPVLYKISKVKKRPMTKVVDEILRKSISDICSDQSCPTTETLQ